jgi:hypothetical protein
MIKLQEIQEYNRMIIICAVNGTKDYEEALKKEIGVGCKVKIKNFITNNEFSEEIFVIDKYCDFFNETFFRKIGSYQLCEIIEIIGKPLTLDRVLLALDFYDIGYIASSSDKILTITIGKIYNNLPKKIVIDWNLTKKTLEEQSEETQRAIYELLIK